MSDKPMAAEVTETTSPLDAMMYWHERAMQAETERDDAIQKHALCLAVATRSTARIAELEAERDAYTARYRWLADKVMACDYADNEFGIVGWIIRHCKGPTWIPGASIDAAIDAARSTQP